MTDIKPDDDKIEEVFGIFLATDITVIAGRGKPISPTMGKTVLRIEAALPKKNNSHEDLKLALPIDKYGKKGAKTFKQLTQEIESGECRIIWIGSRPIRHLEVVQVKVYSGEFSLWEKIQFLANGENRVRNLEGISEKIKPSELPKEAAIRAFKEELNLSDQELSMLSVNLKGSELKEDIVSPSYPGLLSCYKIIKFDAIMPPSIVNIEYVERSPNGTISYFEWRQKS